MSWQGRWAAPAVAWILVGCGTSSSAPGPGGTAGASSDAASVATADTVSDAVAPSSQDTVTRLPETAAPDAAADGAGDVGRGPAPDVSSWCNAWSGAWCALLGRCPWPGATGVPPDCEDSESARCGSGEALAAAAAAGALTFDLDAATRCLDGLSALPCEDFYAAISRRTVVVDACAAVLIGHAGAGQACALTSACAPGLHCAVGNQCPGRCEGLPGPGQPCDPLGFCDFGRATCRAGTCRALPATVGAPCLDNACAPPLVCDPDAGLCAAPGLEHAPCGDGHPTCFPGLVCRVSPGAGLGTCAAPRALGGTCTDHGHCAATPAAVCAGGRCTAAPAAGAPCYDYRCAADARCDTTRLPPTCAALPGSGQPCAPGAACAAGLTCGGAQCEPQRSDGAPCVHRGQCASGRCLAGRCLAPGAAPCPI